MASAFIVAIAVVVIFFIIALISEFGRGMTAAPSTMDSTFWPIMVSGLAIAAVIAVSHYAHFNAGW